MLYNVTKKTASMCYRCQILATSTCVNKQISPPVVIMSYHETCGIEWFSYIKNILLTEVFSYRRIEHKHSEQNWRDETDTLRASALAEQVRLTLSGIIPTSARPDRTNVYLCHYCNCPNTSRHPVCLRDNPPPVLPKQVVPHEVDCGVEG